MVISLLVAMDEQRGIGVNNTLPWRLSSDLKRFKELTMRHHVIVGRKTYDSIGRPLPGRTMVVVSRNRFVRIDGVVVVHTPEHAIKYARVFGESEVFVCGGEQIYKSLIDVADKLYVTKVHTVVEADTFFPEIDEKFWTLESEEHHKADDKNEFDYSFVVYKRNI